MKIFIVSILFVISCNNGFSQNSKTGNWVGYIGNQAINKKWNWHNEIQYRNYNFIGDLQQLLLRTGIGYNLTENNNNILLGYAFVNTQNYIPTTNNKTGFNEHRLYQQFITKQNFSRVFMQHRYRIEERIFASNFQLRLRYSVAFNIPLNNTKMIAKTIYASTSNEIFLNAKKTVFDRNRLYGALGYVFNKSIKAELGFMAQTLETSSRNQFQIMVFNNLPL
jgi:hypothetical protein